jgi:hypothetical protein
MVTSSGTPGELLSAYRCRLTLVNHIGPILTVSLMLYALGVCLFLISEHRRPHATLAWMLASIGEEIRSPFCARPQELSNGVSALVHLGSVKCPRTVYTDLNGLWLLAIFDTAGEVLIIDLTTYELKNGHERILSFRLMEASGKPASRAFLTSPAVSKMTMSQDVVTCFDQLSRCFLQKEFGG